MRRPEPKIWASFEDRIEKFLFTNDEKRSKVTKSDISILQVYSFCNRYRCLPEAGGLYDQDADLMEKFAVIDQVMERKAKYDDRVREMDRKLKERQPK